MTSPAAVGCDWRFVNSPLNGAGGDWRFVNALLDGVAGDWRFVKVRPAMPYAPASSAPGNDLENPFQLGRGDPGGWRIIDQPGLHCGEDI